MKKAFSAFVVLLFSTSSYCQSVTFSQLLHLLRGNNAEQYMTSSPISFVKSHGSLPGDAYKKNEGTANEEEVIYGFKPTTVIYNTHNVRYMNKLIKQIKYPLIIKSVDPKSSTYYQYGDTKMMIMIDIYPNKPASLTMYEK